MDHADGPPLDLSEAPPGNPLGTGASTFARVVGVVALALSPLGLGRDLGGIALVAGTVTAIRIRRGKALGMARAPAAIVVGALALLLGIAPLAAEPSQPATQQGSLAVLRYMDYWPCLARSSLLASPGAIA